jgi:hypothetical protein
MRPTRWSRPSVEAVASCLKRPADYAAFPAEVNGHEIIKPSALILAAAQAEEPPFSCAPHRIKGDPTKIAELERRNYAICRSLTARLKGTGSLFSTPHLIAAVT